MGFLAAIPGMLAGVGGAIGSGAAGLGGLAAKGVGALGSTLKGLDFGSLAEGMLQGDEEGMGGMGGYPGARTPPFQSNRVPSMPTMSNLKDLSTDAITRLMMQQGYDMLKPKDIQQPRDRMRSY